MRTVRATCPFDCPDACGLLVDVEDDRVQKVRGDPDHPYSQGTLCPKVNGYERSVHAPGRLTTPFVRTGPKGEGKFRPVSWDEAIGLVAGKLRETAAAHGPESILPYSYAGTMGLVQRNAGHAFFHALGASRLDRTICSPAKGAGWKAVMGDTIAPHPDEVLQSDLAIVWGLNAVATSIHFAQRIKEARRRGAEVWVVETYRTPTADLADRVFLVRPGSDGALALGMAHVLFRDGLVDRAFLVERVQGWERFRDEVLPECTPAWAAAKTGLEASTVEEMARRYAAARAPFIRLGSGLSRYGNGAMNVRCITCLPALTGAWAKPGGGLLGSTSGSQAFDASIVTREDLQPRPTRLVNMNRLGHALTELDSPRVMAMVVYAANPAAVTPDQEAVLRGLAREDLFTVVHERYLTDTARYADVLLPATTALEHDDLYCSYGQYVIQRVEPAIPPVGQSWSNWDLFRRLAAEIGDRPPLLPPDLPGPGGRAARQARAAAHRHRRVGALRGARGRARASPRRQAHLPDAVGEGRDRELAPAPPAAPLAAQPRGGRGAALPAGDGSLGVGAQLVLPGASRAARARGGAGAHGESGRRGGARAHRSPGGGLERARGGQLRPARHRPDPARGGDRRGSPLAFPRPRAGAR